MIAKTQLTAEYDGLVQTHCLAEWAKLTGISAAVIRKRLTQGWSPDKAVSEPLTRTPKLVTYNGKTQCIAAWSRELDIPPYVLQHRLQQGWSTERALATPVRRINRTASGKILEFQGKALSISSWERECGFPRGIIQQRLSLGWSVEDAITKPIQGTMPRPRNSYDRKKFAKIEFDGESRSIREWASVQNISYNTLLSRLQNGWSIERALTQPVRKKKDFYNLNGGAHE